MSTAACRCALLMGLALAAACSQKVKSPAPPVLEEPSAEAAPPPVDPEIICRDQRSTRVTVHGKGFVPVPIDIPNAPKIALPSVQLARTHALDGDAIDTPDVVLYSGDYLADPTNAADEDGELIEVDGEPLLTWASEDEMSFLVTQELTLGLRQEGEDTRERGALPAGVWDVSVQNPDGTSAESIGALAVTAAPEIESLVPEIVCLEQGPRTIAVTGQSFLRNEGDQAQLAVEGVAEPFAAALERCSAIAHEGLDAEVCESASIELAQDSIEPGYPALTLENPATAACTSEEDVALRVVAAPSVERVVEPLACTADGARTFVVEGEHFLRLDEETTPTVVAGNLELRVVSMECEAMALPAGSRSVELCTSLTFILQEGDLDAGIYDLRVINPDNPGAQDDGCSAMLADALHIVPPPSIEAAEPSFVCLADGAQEITLRGGDFLLVDGVPPAVTLDGEALDRAAVELDACDAPLEAGDYSYTRCDALVITLAASDAASRNPSIAIENPQPAGCASEASDLFTTVPRPALASVTPQPVCNAQGDPEIVLTGEGFLVIDGVAPEVTVGAISAIDVVATATSCEAIEGRSDAALCSELVATIEEGALDAGRYDVVITNTAPAGCATEDAATLTIVDPPEIAAVAPSPICLQQGDVAAAITGAGFIRIGSAQPSVLFGAVAGVDVAVVDASCSALGGVPDGVICTELTATLEMGALADGSTNSVTVTNPGDAACTSEESIDLLVAPPPSITSIDTALVCTGGGTIELTGENLTGVTARLVDPDTLGIVDALSTVVSVDGTSATITFGSGVHPDTYELQISSGSGCGDVAAQAVMAAIGPVAFFMDPPVAYNGVALRSTIYASGVVAAPASVVLTPEGGGSAADEEPLLDVMWPASGSNNEIGATIPEALPEGVYDVTIDFAAGCDTVLAAGLTIEADVTLALATPAIEPQFGVENAPLAVSVRAEAEADLMSGEVNFEPTPRAYLSSASLATAEPLRAVQLDTDERLTAVIPGTLPAGSYDLVVVNPDGAVGFRAAAFEATSVAPPVIDAVAPTQLDNDTDRPITITGSNFINPTTDLEVTLECLASGAVTPTRVGPLAIDGSSTSSTLIATATVSSLSHGTICVVRVANVTNGSFDEHSAIAITNPASKLPPFQNGTTLVEGRRAPATVFGAATGEARFLYAIGGDDGATANAKTSVEAAPIGRFGVLGAFRTVATELPAGVTHAHAISAGPYIYLFGGLIGGAPSDAIHRAQVVSPVDAPAITNVDLRFYSGVVDADPQTREGLAPGALTYAIAAVFDAGDTDNPGGESLPSEPLTLYAPDVPDGVEVELSWDPVLGADGVTEAVAYRIYRTAGPGSPLSTLSMLAEVAAPDNAYVDQNPALFLDAEKHPLVIGDLGEWRELPEVLNTPRAAYAVAIANDPSCAPYVYVVGGLTDAATQSNTYEYASLDLGTGALGAFTEATGAGLDARREHALFVADDKTSAFINTGAGACESYVYASSGFTGSTSFVTTIQEAAVQAGGALGAFTTALSSGSSSQDFAGHAAFFSSDGAYVLGGAASTGTPRAASSIAQQAELDSGDVPNLDNFSSASSNLLIARYLPGFARQGAFFYLIGGASSAGVALSSTERNVR